METSPGSRVFLQEWLIDEVICVDNAEVNINEAFNWIYMQEKLIKAKFIDEFASFYRQ